jgi:GDP-4-dehydro-6-deoxy-D-mannose reductase
MTVLITGCFGFVGSYLVDHILDEDPAATVVGVDRTEAPSSMRIARSYTVDLLDSDAIAGVIERERPRYLVHLASFSSVGFSWQDPVASFTNNTNIFLHVLEAVRRLSPQTRVLSVGSSEEYGIVTPDELPLRETSPLRPVSPYAAARVAQEHLGDVYVRGYGLDIVSTRSFNHIGPRQSDQFVIAAIARQVAAIARGQADELRVGTTSVIRDFLDVRDVVRAYWQLLHKGERGEVYNVCSGKGHSIDDVIRLLQDIAGIRVTVTTDPARLRPVENPVVVGSHDKLLRATAWTPHYNLRDSLGEVYRTWYEQLG